MSKTVSTLIVTHIPSPYQVELFNQIAVSNIVDLTIAYIYQSSTTRSWSLPKINHNHIFLDDDIKKYIEVTKLVNIFDLVIFNYYQHPQIIKLINHRAASKKAWCFWGERIGYNRLGYLGTYYRKWKLSALHHSQAPIWGIGNWAIAKYQKEFGSKRHYFNFPYFSELKHFSHYKKQTLFDNKSRNFLFSGSLIPRKGIDLLAAVFCELADEFNHIQLKIMGNGKMRLRLEEQLSKYHDRVEFLGFQSWENLPNFYHQADILCVPSRHDGWGLVVPEGLASGLPVIGTNRTGAALEFLKEGNNGWLVKAGDKHSLYRAMKEAISLSETELLSYSAKAQQSVVKHSLTDGVEKFHYYVAETIKVFQ
ncbi:glycosyltransferase [Xenococcus sp. PCC 7305]|uniref:glycosyltransferase family 4 protein n=1 Tax=Xenococcus sp. PCC 7305 TaxID=102125 RepID=UPI0002ABAE01|nr:glycosyltransferase family 4 protein [Xenococcus sp. PCC 7305]ELS02164.1 glycosyltransferase [Xenococcus sp. PCC 7305]